MENRYKQIEKYYDDYSTWYDEERIEGYYSFINHIEIDAVRKYGTNKKILEIGCGTGIILNQTSKFSKEAWGIDLSPEMVEVTKSKGLNAKVSSATKLPFKDNSFDVVYSFKVLAHIPDIEQAICEIIRVTKPGGTLILEFYNPWSFKYITNILMKSNEKVYTRFDRFNKIKDYLGKVAVIELIGARVFSPIGKIYATPPVGNLLVKLEMMASKTIFARAAGYFIVIGKKPH